MAVHFLTTTPTKLLATFKKAIDDGHVVTWSYDKDGDFTHTVDQWENQAWLRPKIGGDRLLLNIIKPEEANVSTDVYAIYHGRFIESVLAHCDKLFTAGYATALPEADDTVSE